MEKTLLIRLLSDIFIPIGFKRKGNNWVYNGEYLSKIINLQRSNYGNSFYINYGFIIKGLELTTTYHVHDRLASVDKVEQDRITTLLDLDVEMSREFRLVELNMLIKEKIVLKIQSINTVVDLFNALNERLHLNDIPMVVKKYFKLE